MDGEVGFDGLRVGLQMVDPRVVTLLLRRQACSWPSIAFMRAFSILVSRASIRLKRLAMPSSCWGICGEVDAPVIVAEEAWVDAVVQAH